MSISNPFTPAVLTAGILTNIATDILKHHAQALEGTLVGRMLKWAGLIEPNFDDRLRDTLSKALSLYFETHTQYKLTGVTAFFRDPAVARQIGGYILDRKPLDQGQIQQALDRHLGSDAITKTLIPQRGLEPERIVPSFLECYRRVLGEQLSVPQMAILLEIVDQTDTVITEMRASEERLAAVVQQVISRVDAQAEKLDGIDADLQAIKQHLGLDRPQTVIIEEIKAALDAAPRGEMFKLGGLCSGYPLRPMPDRYFVAQDNRRQSMLRDHLGHRHAKVNHVEVTVGDHRRALGAGRRQGLGVVVGDAGQEGTHLLAQFVAQFEVAANGVILQPLSKGGYLGVFVLDQHKGTPQTHSNAQFQVDVAILAGS